MTKAVEVRYFSQPSAIVMEERLPQLSKAYLESLVIDAGKLTDFNSLELKAQSSIDTNLVPKSILFIL